MDPLASIRRLVVVLAFPALASADLHSQQATETQPVTWGIMAAGDGITGAYRGTLVSGIAGGVLAQVPLPSRHLSVRADLVYHWVGTNGGDQVDVLTSSSRNGRCTGGFLCSVEGAWSRVVATSISIVARLNDPSTSWSPYLIGGVAGYLTGNSDEPLYQFQSEPPRISGRSRIRSPSAPTHVFLGDALRRRAARRRCSIHNRNEILGLPK